jgi:hypothetical protein
MDKLGAADYLKEMNTKFQIAETAFEIELIEVSERNIAPKQEMFSLLFAGGKDSFLPQQIYRLRHANLGDGDLFLVPIKEETERFIYEASFNRAIA